MTVNFPSAHPANTAPAGKPVDIQTLQEAFAAALRNYGTERGGSFTDTMLEVLRAPHTNNPAGEDRNQQRREQQQQADRNDFTNIDRKLLDRSEIRSRDMNTAYQDRIDRNETFRNDYRERIERGELQQSTLPASPTPTTPASPATSTATSAATSLGNTRPNESVQNKDHSPPSQHPPASVNTNSPSLSANTHSTPNIGLANVLISGGNTPASMPTPTAPQTVPPQAFTIFTPSGRFGQTHRKADKKENATEEPVEGKETKKHQPFAEFEAIYAETIHATRQNTSQQPKAPITPSELQQPGHQQPDHQQPDHQQIIEKQKHSPHAKQHTKQHAKPKEIEPDPFQHSKTLEKFLNTPGQNISVQKKKESSQPNQTQYLNRIAAACEAAAHYAPVRIKINLDHLGTLTLRFFHKADKLMLRFETPSKESAKFLREQLDGLRTILSKRNIRIADVEILANS